MQPKQIYTCAAVLLLLALIVASCNTKRIEGSESSDSTFSGHPFTFYTQHNAISQACKDLVAGVRSPSDDDDVLAVLSGMFTADREIRPFYFLAVTRTMDEADGAYAEALGVEAKRFVELNTIEFVDYFRTETLLTDQDFEEWAISVAGEIEILNEPAELDNFKSSTEANCTSCDEGQQKVLKDFIERVYKHCPPDVFVR